MPCHPTHAQRTKCVCGAIVNLRGAVSPRATRCACGRFHSKVRGSGFERGYASDGRITTGSRKGGKRGCPGCGRSPSTGGGT